MAKEAVAKAEASVAEAPKTLTQALAGIDNFPVKWAGRDTKGQLTLSASVFSVPVTPPTMFGQNIKDFGLAYAEKASELEGDPEDHDFGACGIRRDSLRRIGDRWFVDLTVPRHNRRTPLVTTKLVDDDGNAIFDENGNEQVKTAARQESWVTCELSMLEPLPKHPLSASYVQPDRETMQMVSVNASSAKRAKGKEKGAKKGRSKGRRARVASSDIAALLQSKAD